MMNDYSINNPIETHNRDTKAGGAELTRDSLNAFEETR